MNTFLFPFFVRNSKFNLELSSLPHFRPLLLRFDSAAALYRRRFFTNNSNNDLN